MHGISGGTEALPHIVRAYLAAHPTHVAAKTDVASAFQEVHREYIIAAAAHYPSLTHLVHLVYGDPTAVIYRDAASGATLNVRSERGVNQGCPLAALLYSTSLRHAVDATLRAHPGVTIRGVADDRVFLGLIDDVLPALSTYKSELAFQGQRLQSNKTVIYAPSTGCTNGAASIAAKCAAAGYPTGQGILIAGSPVGDTPFVQATLSGMFDDIAGKIAAIRTLDLATVNKRTTRQGLYKAVRFCIAPASVNYLLRTTPPAQVAMQAARFDDETYRLIMAIFSVSSSEPAANPASPDGALTKLRVHLAAAAGGLGVTSAVAASIPAYVGSVCLTAHLVQAAVGDAFTQELAAATFPELVTALASPAFASSERLKDTTLASVFTTAVPKVQAALNRAALPGALNTVLNSVVDLQDKALLLAGGGLGAAFLTEAPRIGDCLSDTQFCVLVRARLNLRVVDGCSTCMQCPRCAGIKSSNGTPLSAESTVLRPNGTHALACMQPGEGGAQGRRSAHHKHVKFVIREVLQALSRPGTAIEKAEPIVANYYPRKVEGGTRDADPERADIAVAKGGRTILLDLVISHPNASRGGAATTPTEPATCAASRSARLSKLNMYNKHFVIPDGYIVPLSFETSGFADPETVGFLKDYVKYGMSTGPATEPVWTRESKIEYAARVRWACSTIAIAVARTVANTLLHGATTLTERGHSASPGRVLRP